MAYKTSEQGLTCDRQVCDYWSAQSLGIRIRPKLKLFLGSTGTALHVNFSRFAQ
jgi:hypothetical protein